MNASVYVENQNMVFKLSDIPEEWQKSVEAEYFTPDGDGYIKAFPKDAPYIEVAAENFVHYAEKIFDESRAEDPSLWQKALTYFIDRMKGQGVEWFLTGSCALAVRGIDVRPGDVDIVFPHVSDLPLVRYIFVADTVQPFVECGGWVAKAYGSAFAGFVLGMAFETAECLDLPEPIDSGPYAASHLEEITWNGRSIKVAPMELALNINKRRGRNERVRLIEEYLK